MKKFKDTKFGKLVTSRIGKIAIKSIPMIGGPLGNILDDTTERETERVNGGIRTERVVRGSESGSLTGDELTALITSIILGGLLVYALITGDWETAEKGKSFIEN